MKLHIELDFKYRRETERDGKKVKERVTETRSFERDLDELPLVLFSVAESENIEDMRQGIIDFLDLTEEEGRQVSIGHVKKVTAAITAAQEIPNG